MTQLAINRFKRSAAEYERNVHVAYPEHGTPFEALLDPGYWAHVSATMKIGDKIEVTPDDMSYSAELRVLDVGTLFAKVGVYHKVDWDDVEVTGDLPAKSGLEIKFRGPHLRWCVLRGADALKERCMSRGDAEVWCKEYLKVVGNGGQTQAI